MDNQHRFSATAYIVTREKDTPERTSDLCRYAGLAGIEAAPPLIEGMKDKEVEDLGLKLGNLGVERSTFHLPFGAGFDISEFYETRRRKAVSDLSYWIERAALLGSEIGIIHPSVASDPVEIEGLDRYLDRLERSLDELVPVCEGSGFNLAVENMLPDAKMGGVPGYRFFSRPAHISAFAGRFRHPRVGFCLDTGHALVSMGTGRELEILDAMGERTIAYHLSDSSGDRDMHIAPGRGNVDWKSFFHHPQVAAFSGVFCIETPPFAHGPGYADDAWREMVSDVRALMR